MRALAAEREVLALAIGELERLAELLQRIAKLEARLKIPRSMDNRRHKQIRSLEEELDSARAEMSGAMQLLSDAHGGEAGRLWLPGELERRTKDLSIFIASREQLLADLNAAIAAEEGNRLLLGACRQESDDLLRKHGLVPAQVPGSLAAAKRRLELIELEISQWKLRLSGRAGSAADQSVLYNAENFWEPFRRDLKGAARSVLIVSAFISLERTLDLIDDLTGAIKRAVRVTAFVRPPDPGRADCLEAMEILRKAGVRVVQRHKIHQKVAVIDQRIAWEGSLNILAHKNSLDQMRRWESRKIAEEIWQNLQS